MAAELSAVPGAGRPEMSRKQRMILQFIGDYVLEQGYPPTTTEIGAEVGLTSKSSVVWQLRQLEHKGYLVRTHTGRSRALRIVPGPGEARVTPDDLDELEMDLTDAWHQLSRAELGDVALAEFLQLRPDERAVWERDGTKPARLRPYWRWLHRSLGLPAGDRR